jgi:uncharacterized membrane protein
LVNIEQVKPINNQKSADIMKYIVSGGVMEMDEHQEIKK